MWRGAVALLLFVVGMAGAAVAQDASALAAHDPGIVRICVTVSDGRLWGSGCYVQHGHAVGVLTAAHCVRGGGISIHWPDGTLSQGNATSDKTGADVAFVAIDVAPAEATPRGIAARAAGPSDPVAICGYPAGEPQLVVRWTNVDPKGRRFTTLTQYATWVVSGDSGGPAIDAAGQVLGVQSVGIDDDGVGTYMGSPWYSRGAAVDQPTLRAFMDRVAVRAAACLGVAGMPSLEEAVQLADRDTSTADDRVGVPTQCGPGGCGPGIVPRGGILPRGNAGGGGGGGWQYAPPQIVPRGGAVTPGAGGVPPSVPPGAALPPAGGSGGAAPQQPVPQQPVQPQPAQPQPAEIDYDRLAAALIPLLVTDPRFRGPPGLDGLPGRDGIQGPTGPPGPTGSTLSTAQLDSIVARVTRELQSSLRYEWVPASGAGYGAE